MYIFFQTANCYSKCFEKLCIGVQVRHIQRIYVYSNTNQLLHSQIHIFIRFSTHVANHVRKNKQKRTGKQNFYPILSPDPIFWATSPSLVVSRYAHEISGVIGFPSHYITGREFLQVTELRVPSNKMIFCQGELSNFFSFSILKDLAQSFRSKVA